MAQFDYYRQIDGPGFWLDCQTDLMEDFEVRFCVPLVPLDLAPKPVRQLNPVFELEGGRFSMLTQFSGSLPVGELRQPVGSLADRRYEIVNALDFLMAGV